MACALLLMQRDTAPPVSTLTAGAAWRCMAVGNMVLIRRILPSKAIMYLWELQFSDPQTGAIEVSWGSHGANPQNCAPKRLHSSSIQRRASKTAQVPTFEGTEFGREERAPTT